MVSMRLTSPIFWIADSIGSETSVATSWAVAPGYCVTTTAILMVKAGSSSRPSEEKPQMPPRRQVRITIQV